MTNSSLPHNDTSGVSARWLAATRQLIRLDQVARLMDHFGSLLRADTSASQARYSVTVPPSHRLALVFRHVPFMGSLSASVASDPAARSTTLAPTLRQLAPGNRHVQKFGSVYIHGTSSAMARSASSACSLPRLDCYARPVKWGDSLLDLDTFLRPARCTTDGTSRSTARYRSSPDLAGAGTLMVPACPALCRTPSPFLPDQPGWVMSPSNWRGPSPNEAGCCPAV